VQFLVEACNRNKIIYEEKVFEKRRAAGETRNVNGYTNRSEQNVIRKTCSRKYKIFNPLNTELNPICQ